MTDTLSEDGFAVIENVFSAEEIDQLLSAISSADVTHPAFRRSSEVFAIRQFFKYLPSTINYVFNDNLIQIVNNLFGKEYFVVKSIYFDKPASSNWFVAYHQDLTIEVDQKLEMAGFGPWTVKGQQFAVQPPVDILEDNFTIRIHLDDTDELNGALKLVPGSHLRGICRQETLDWSQEKQTVCPVKKGGIMIMKPLLLHSSGRTVNQKQRRVVHIEFSRKDLPAGLDWAERILVPDKLIVKTTKEF